MSGMLFEEHASCESCYGSGKMLDHSSDEEREIHCDCCKGTGLRLTHLGLEIVTLLDALMIQRKKERL